MHMHDKVNAAVIFFSTSFWPQST